jgi:PhnB protein
METLFKPEGYNAISPYFVVEGAQRLIDLLKDVFEAKELRRYDLEDGSIMHAEMGIDDSVIMLGDKPEKFEATRMLVHVYVPDVAQTWEKAMKAGCLPLEAPKTKEGDPDHRGSFQDFAGNVWSIATQRVF